jgi:hypothetical protein
MSLTDLLSSVDSEIAILKEARALLAGHDGHIPRTSKAGKKRITMSAEARKRIGDAQRKRWAARKKAAK